MAKTHVCHEVDLLTDCKSMAVCQGWDKQDFNFQTQIFGKSFLALLLWGNNKN